MTPSGGSYFNFAQGSGYNIAPDQEAHAHNAAKKTKGDSHDGKAKKTKRDKPLWSNSVSGGDNSNNGMTKKVDENKKTARKVRHLGNK